MVRFLSAAMTMVMLALFAGPARAAEPEDVEAKTPDATVRLKTGSVGLGVGVGWGSGTLEYKGKSYPVKVKGLSLGDVGIANAEATGKVYHLDKLDEFSGNYTALGAGAAVGGGAGASIMKNQNGVVMELTSTTQGAKLKAGVDGIKVELENPTAGTKGEDQE